MAKANLRLKGPASHARVLSRVALLDVVWGGLSPVAAFLLRDGAIKSPDAVAAYCGISFLAALCIFQWFQTSSPISKYFSIRDALDLLKACIVTVAVSAVLGFVVTRLQAAPRSIPVLQFILLTSGLFSARLFWRLRETRHEAKSHKSANSVQHVLLIQASRLAWFFSKMLEELAPGEYQIVAILDERPALQHRSLNGYPIVGSPSSIDKIVDEYATHGIRIDSVIVATKPELLSRTAWDMVARACLTRGIELEILPEHLVGGLSKKIVGASGEPYAADAACISFGSLETLPARPFWVVKRILDIAVAIAAALVTLPLAVAVFGLALLDVGIPVIFWQQRVGRNGHALHLYKFRTLQTLFDRHTQEKREANNPSAVGRFLQKTRLDELPQLWNILSGDMSLIGPRPLLPVDQPNEPSIRLTVRPGLSGWAQVCGGKLISPEEKNALDEWYIRHASLWLDTLIVFRTLWMLLIGDRRDEKAISAALAQRYQSAIQGLSESIAREDSERRTEFEKHSAVMRTMDMDA
ncbi:MAG TPA: sugar transferase, partial [Bradyrhizobium sp.]|nr:sugar transferase [Bradyrhizobium sp.]